MDAAAYHDSATILEDEENATVDEALETHSEREEVGLSRATVINFQLLVLSLRVVFYLKRPSSTRFRSSFLPSTTLTVGLC